jgi:DNA-binding transcriptional regulator YhcF (GntR family)
MLHMKQKDYTLEIVGELLKGENHLRLLASKLGTNPMMVSRKLEELSTQNIVDYKVQGKNKVYFLKKTIEAKLLILMAENYKLICLLEKSSSFRQIIEYIKKNKKICLAIFSGPYAEGTQTSKSKIEIYIDTEDKITKKELEKIDSKISVKACKYDENNPAIREMEKSKVIIKGAEEYYEKNKFFE